MRATTPVRSLSLPVLAVALAAAAGTRAQDATPTPVLANGPLEEVVVLGRARSAATDVVSERIDAAVAMDFIDAAAISRVGDSDVAGALRRLPGVTLAQDKFIYVRGLGERYSSAQLNGAQVPSPDLTRNVLPLDIFPTEIIDALSVQKGYSPGAPAAFGGGNVNIRTKSVPEGLVFTIKLNTGWNSEGDADGLTYAGGGDDSFGEDDGTRALPAAIRAALDTYEGNFSAQNILSILDQDGTAHSFAEAQAINRELAAALNRNVDLKRKDMDPDLQGQVTLGYRWFLGEDESLELGFLALGSWDNAWRNHERTNRRISSPETDFSETRRTVQTVSTTGSLNLGARWIDDHKLDAMLLFLRNTEDEASLSRTCNQGQFNDCADSSNPAQGRVTNVRFEQRELDVLQFSGEHVLGVSTLARLDTLTGGRLAALDALQGLKANWYWSDAEASTDIPNEVRISAEEALDPATGAVLSSRIRALTTAGDFRFSELEDNVESYGASLTLPLRGDGWDLELASGYDVVTKGRAYRQFSIGLGSTSNSFQEISTGTPSEVFSDANILDPANGLGIALGVGGFGSESYFAGQITDALYGKFDLLLNETWRISGGARWENFQQVSVPVDLLIYNGSRITQSAEQIAAGALNADAVYPALQVTWIRPGFLAEEFQLRAGYSETVTRPDLREISNSTFIDPLTEARVRGNPNLRPATLDNWDLRAEWFFANGDNLSLSLFYKDITDPIETVEGGASEDNILFNFVNAGSAQVYGMELEGLKGLDWLGDVTGGRIGDWVDQFYVAGNLTLSDSAIDIPAGAGVGNLTNDNRRLTQHSEWVANLQLGFDSFDGMHSATLVYNAFGERVFYAGVNGFDDAFEQPFHALDLVYSWFPTEHLSARFRVKNLLDDDLQIEQDGVTVIEQTVGTSFLLDLKYAL